jgi:hypothetical protein
MLCVFFRFPLTGVQGATFSPVQSRAATAAAEVLNTVEWLTVN